MPGALDKALSTQVEHMRPGKNEPPSRVALPILVSHLLETSIASPSPLIPIQKGNSDPFNATALPLTPEYAELLRFAADFRTKLVWPTEATLRKSHGPLLESNVASYQACLSTTATMHGLFAYSWSWLARLNPELAPTYRKKADKHSNDAVKELQGLLASNQDVGTLQAMLQATIYLACVESHRSNFDNTMTHLNASKRILDLVGGLRALHWVHQEAIINVFITFAGNTRSRPALHPNEWDPGSLKLQRWWQRRQRRGLLRPSSTALTLHVDAAQREEVHSSSPISSIFVALRELVIVQNLKIQYAKDDSPEVNLMFRWSLRRRYAIRGHILLYWCDLTDGTNAVDPPTTINPHITTVKRASIEICMCLATKLFELALLEEMPSSTGKWVRQVLAVHAMLLKCVMGLDTGSGAEETESQIWFDLFWMYSVGASVEQKYLAASENTEREGLKDFDLQAENGRWFSMMFATLARNLKRDRFQDVSALLAHLFVYSEAAQDSIVKDLLEPKSVD